jgi:hypothetical protein
MGWADTIALSRAAAFYRLLIGGVDVTYFRGFATPVPRLMLTEPYAFGATDIQFPQVHAGLEQCGVGDLAWVKPDSRVIIQMVDDPTIEHPTVLATLYKGWVDDIEVVSGRLLNLPCSGEVSGRLGMMDRPVPRFRKLADVGHWAALAAQLCGVHFEPQAGPVTGIKLADDGDMSESAWLDKVCQESQNRDGNQSSFMPKGDWGAGVWQFAPKDTTTVAFTLFNDDARVVLDVQRVSAEETNTYWGRGVDPDGLRWFNGVYPGLTQGPPAPYPYTDTSTNFNVGTTDGDTDTGDGVRILWLKLTEMHYLSTTPPYGGVFTDAMGEAVADLKRDAGLPDSSVVTYNAWKALFNIDVTGYSISDARCKPLLQDSDVRKWNLTSNGSYAGQNPDFNKNVRRRDRAIDFGRCSKPDAIRWVRGDHAKAEGTPNWTGTITLNGVSGFAGSHANPTGLTADDIYEYWKMLPGQNVRLPYFDGGTVFHIAGAEVSVGSVVLHVDTRARDLMDLASLRARNSDARRNTRREWRIENRGTKASNNMVTFDEFGGRLAQDVPLVGGQWNVVEIPMGQHGQVNRTNLQVTGSLVDGSTTGWCMAVVAAQWSGAQFSRRVGNPFPVDSNGATVWESTALVDLYDDGILLYSAGNVNQPCGYWPRKHTGDTGSTTDADVTGRWRDDQAWPYITAPEMPLITLGIYPATDGVLKAGILFKKQEDDAT